MPDTLKIAAEPQSPSGGGLESASGVDSSYGGSYIGMPSAWQSAGAGGAPSVAFPEVTSGGGGSSETVLQGATPAGAGGGPQTASTAEAKPPIGPSQRSSDRGVSAELARSAFARIGEPSKPALATPPAFPGPVGADPKLPEGAGSRDMLAAQAGYASALPASVEGPEGTIGSGMSQASGAEGPRDEGGTGPYGGGGAAYTASLGLATPERVHIDSRGKVDFAGQRGKSNGATHDWAQAVADKEQAISRFVEASDAWDKTRREIAELDQAMIGMYEDAPGYAAMKAESDRLKQEVLPAQYLEAQKSEDEARDAETRENQAWERMSKGGNPDGDKRQGLKDLERIRRREKRADARRLAAARRSAKRWARKGRAWQRERRRQLKEREVRNDRRRERRLQRALSKESAARWSAAQRQVERAKDKLDEVQNAIDDPKTPPSERARLEALKYAIEDMIKGLRIDQYWEEHGGFPAAEIDCCDPKYAKCRPPCTGGKMCICRKPPNCPDVPVPGVPVPPEPEQPGPITPHKGKHADKHAQPPDIEQPEGQAGGGDSGPRGAPPGRESPDGTTEEPVIGAESPDDGSPGEPDEQSGPADPDAPPHVFPAGYIAYNLVPDSDGTWLVRGKDGRLYRLMTPPRRLYRDIHGWKYDLAGIRREDDPVDDDWDTKPGKLERYALALGSIAEDTLMFAAQVGGMAFGTGMSIGMTLGSWISGNEKPTLEELAEPLKKAIANTDFTNLGTVEKLAVSTLASFVEGAVAQGETAKQIVKGFVESPQAIAKMLKDAVNGDEKAQLSLLLMAATLRPGKIIKTGNPILGKVKSVSWATAKNLEGATVEEIAAAIKSGRPMPKKGGGAGIRVAVDKYGRLTTIERETAAAERASAKASKGTAKPPDGPPPEEPPSTAGGGKSGSGGGGKRPTASGESDGTSDQSGRGRAPFDPFSRLLHATLRKIQSIYSQHAAAFGLDPAWSAANGQALLAKLREFVGRAEMKQGSWRSIKGTHFFDRQSGLWVFRDANGDLVTAYRIANNPTQWRMLLRDANPQLGGG